MSNRIVIYFKSLPKPIQWSTYFYVSSLLIYNGASSYIDGKNALTEYRTQTPFNFKHVLTCNNEFEAVKYGSSYNFYNRFLDSVIWPVSITSNIIPYIVLSLNPKNPPKEL